MEDHTDPLRRTVLKLLGSGTTAGIALGGAGNVAAADESEETYSPFTDEELAELRAALQRNANESLAEEKSEDGTPVSQQSIPSWVPALPSEIPFTWCLKNIPYAAEVCSFANSPIKNGTWQCNGSTYIGTTASAGVAYGPSVNVSGENFYGEIQNEATMDLFYDPGTDCFAIKYSSGPVEGCTQFRCIPDLPSPSASITKLANALWDTSEDLARSMWSSIGYIPPTEILLATTVVIAVIFAFVVIASPAPP